MARILLIDDEGVARALYGDVLTAAGHEVTCVEDAQKARSALERDRFDAVITDLLMPGAGGMDVLRLAKQVDESLEVIVITALDKVEPAVHALKAGASEYLVKPVRREALLHAVSRALTTRALLEENQTLRRWAHLADAGARLSTTLDRAQLGTEACGAFRQHAGAEAVALFERTFEGPRLLDCANLSAEEVAQLRARVETDPDGTLLSASELEDGRRRAWVSRAVVDGSAFGTVILFSSRSFGEDSVQAATYLSRHLALGLRNVGKLSQAEDLAYLDDLTQLFNARYLASALEREISLTEASGQPFSLLFLDLDSFKAINDTHGHRAGSRLLVEVARVLEGCVRERDVVVRYGGDEYVILLRGTDADGAMRIAERIRKAIFEHVFLSADGLALRMSTCVGVASYPEHARDEEALLELADRAMYQGKRGGRNLIRLARADMEATPASRRGLTG